MLLPAKTLLIGSEGKILSQFLYITLTWSLFLGVRKQPEEKEAQGVISTKFLVFTDMVGKIPGQNNDITRILESQKGQRQMKKEHPRMGDTTQEGASIQEGRPDIPNH